MNKTQETKQENTKEVKWGAIQQEEQAKPIMQS